MMSSRGGTSANKRQPSSPDGEGWDRDAAGAEGDSSSSSSLRDPLLNGEGFQNGTKLLLVKVSCFIIACEFCERLAYYSLAASLVLLFEKQIHMSNATADAQYALWSGMCYLTPLLGGWLADAYLGRYRAILYFSVFYLLGLVMATAGTIPGHVTLAAIYPGIYLVALGTGGIKPCVSTFGAAQITAKGGSARDKERFFSFFYFSINGGALLSYTVVSYVCQFGIPNLGGEAWGFVVGYSIPCVAMALAILIFVSGSSFYVFEPPAGSCIGPSLRLIWDAARAMSHAREGCVGFDAPSWERDYKKHWLRRASREEGGRWAENLVFDVWRVYRLLPILLLQIPFWAVYAQMSTAFQNQGCVMALPGSFPVSALNMFDTIAILLLIPLFDQLLFPALKRVGYPLGMLSKISFGFGAAIISMLIAAVVELARKNNINTEAALPSSCGEGSGVTSSVSILWQVPQFLAIGTSEVLAAVTAMELVYSASPDSMKSLAAAMNLLCTALGSWLTIPLLSFVNSFKEPWVPSDLNGGHLEYYLLTLAGIMFVALLCMIKLTKGYTYLQQGGDHDMSPSLLRRAEIEEFRMMTTSPHNSSLHKLAIVEAAEMQH